MDAEKYLKSLEAIYRQITVIKIQIAELEATLTDIGGFDYSKDRVKSSPSGGAGYEKKIEAIDKLERDVKTLEQRYQNARNNLIDMIRSLNLTPREKRYARLRWLEFRGNIDISQMMHFHRNTARNLEKTVIRKVQAKIDEKNEQKSHEGDA